jgi:hypothetical protein
MTIPGTAHQQDHDGTAVTITGQTPSPDRDTPSRPPSLCQSRILDTHMLEVEIVNMVCVHAVLR